MTARTTIGIVAAALLVGVAGARAQESQFDRAFQAVTGQQQKAEPQKQKAQKQKAAKQAARKAPAQRAPTRVTVRPVLRYRADSTEFPRTDNLGYPGPNAVRQCVSWLQPEYRLSGTVVTPQMRCWWQRG
jgi:hypothetical protein